MSMLDEIINGHRCVEHGRMMPHFGCRESIELETAEGRDASPWSTAHQRHVFVPYVGKTFATGDVCGVVDDGLVCGWPRAAHMS